MAPSISRRRAKQEKHSEAAIQRDDRESRRQAAKKEESEKWQFTNNRESKYWWYKFVWNGEPIRESTKQTNKRVAEQMEAAHRTALAKGEVGI
jgi:spore germination protein GerM